MPDEFNPSYANPMIWQSFFVVGLIDEGVLQNGWEAVVSASIWYTYARRFWRQASPPAAKD